MLYQHQASRIGSGRALHPFRDMRALEDLEPVRRFLELKAEIAERQAELDELKPLIYDALTDEPADFQSANGSFTCDGFRLTTGTRKTYAYSEQVQALSRELRSLKRAEERDGTAELVRATGYVVVNRAPDAFPFLQPK